MSGEKRALRRHKFFWFVCLLLGIIAIVIMILLCTRKANVVAVDGYIDYYSQSLDYTIFEVVLSCDCEVSGGYATIAFYDEARNLITTQHGYFMGTYTDLYSTFHVDGQALFCQVVNYDINAHFDGYEALLIVSVAVFIVFVVFVEALTLSCKEYNYNGDQIIVYAGWFHHYIKFNGVKTDEQNTFTSFVPIFLSCTLIDGTLIEATITQFNRISLKINNLLYT